MTMHFIQGPQSQSTVHKTEICLSSPHPVRNGKSSVSKVTLLFHSGLNCLGVTAQFRLVRSD